MDPDRFTATEFGRATRDGAGFWYFEPEPIPRRVSLSDETIMALSAADTALGRLASAGKYLRDPAVFVRPYVTREAVASSRIEGTEASLSDVFQAAAGADDPPRRSEVREVQRYIAALDYGLDRLAKLPISIRLMRELHEVLMRGVRGREKRPGDLREGPVYIGSTTDSPETAVFVPPQHSSLESLLSDWEQFAHETPRIPLLIQCALLHYQFETIHPFIDGNGRLGRLFIVFFLLERQKLPAPLLYISGYLEDYRREYYDRLQGVRERAEVEEWIQFFLTAVTAQAEDAVERAEQLFELREQYRRELAGSRSRASEVVDLFFDNPYFTASLIAEQLGITSQGALKLARNLEARGWVRPLGTIGRGGKVLWIADQVYDILEHPPERLRPPRTEPERTQASG